MRGLPSSVRIRRVDSEDRVRIRDLNRTDRNRSLNEPVLTSRNKWPSYRHLKSFPRSFLHFILTFSLLQIPRSYICMYSNVLNFYNIPSDSKHLESHPSFPWQGSTRHYVTFPCLYVHVPGRGCRGRTADPRSSTSRWLTFNASTRSPLTRRMPRGHGQGDSSV